jgi:sugar phosphate isomerase/epimerase
LGKLEISSVGWLSDIERQGYEFVAMMKESEQLFAMASSVGRAERDNLKIVVDFYHNYVSGLKAEFLSKINKDMILGVHICNSREPDDRVPCEEIFRDATFYGGAVPIKEWVDAVKSTGFAGWWAYETFSKREAEEEIYDFTKYVYGELKKLIAC